MDLSDGNSIPKPSRKPERDRATIRAGMQRLVGAAAMLVWILRAWSQYYWWKLNVGRWVNLLAMVNVGLLILEIVLHQYGASIASSGALWLQLIFLLVLIVSSWNHYRAWKDHLQQVYFIEAASKLAQVLGPTQFAERTGRQLLLELLSIFRENFVRKAAVNVNIFVHDPGLNVLVFGESFPVDAPVDRVLTFAPGIGGAGVAYQERAVVYIPWRAHKAAVVQQLPVSLKAPISSETMSTAAGSGRKDDPSMFSLISNCCVDDAEHAFESVLTVPILYRGECFGVLNLDSAKANAFRIRDFPQAMFYGMVIGILMSEVKRAGGTVL